MAVETLAVVFQTASAVTTSAQRAVERRRSAQRGGVRSNGWLDGGLFTIAPNKPNIRIEQCLLRRQDRRNIDIGLVALSPMALQFDGHPVPRRL